MTSKRYTREKIDLSVITKKVVKAKLVFRVISVYPSDLIQLSLRYDKFDKYEDGENVVIDTAYTIDPSLDPKDIKNLNVLARSVFVEMAPLELEWQTDDLDMECATIVFETKVIEEGSDLNVVDIPWSTSSVLVDITEQPELCQVSMAKPLHRCQSCTENAKKYVRSVRNASTLNLSRRWIERKEKSFQNSSKTVRLALYHLSPSSFRFTAGRRL